MQTVILYLNLLCINITNVSPVYLKFPDIFKTAEVKPVFESQMNIENYRLVRILPVISKISERLIFKRLIFLNKSFLNISADFQKVIMDNTVHSLCMKRMEKNFEIGTLYLEPYYQICQKHLIVCQISFDSKNSCL